MEKIEILEWKIVKKQFKFWSSRDDKTKDSNVCKKMKNNMKEILGYDNIQKIEWCVKVLKNNDIEKSCDCVKLWMCWVNASQTNKMHRSLEMYRKLLEPV